MRKTVLALLLAASATPAAAAVELVTNGGFEDTSPAGQYGEVDFNTTLNGWSATGGYSFLMNTSNAVSGVTGQYGDLALWGVGNGGSDTITASPDGGNFVGQDLAFQDVPLTQTLTGLTIGAQYAVSFYWGVGQQSTFNGDTFDAWSVSLGSETHSTATVDNPSHAFQGWWKQSYIYTATSTSETLSFLAVGGPPGVPPFALLDGVSVTAVPEASTWAMLVLGFARSRLRRVPYGQAQGRSCGLSHGPLW